MASYSIVPLAAGNVRSSFASSWSRSSCFANLPITFQARSLAMYSSVVLYLIAYRLTTFGFAAEPTRLATSPSASRLFRGRRCFCMGSASRTRGELSGPPQRSTYLQAFLPPGFFAGFGAGAAFFVGAFFFVGIDYTSLN